MVDIDDAKFMLYVTSLNCKNTESMNDTLYKVLSVLEIRHCMSFMQPGVTVPTSQADANRYVLKGEFAIMDLLPKPKLHIIAEHACFCLDDVISLHLALGQSIKFTVIPWPELNMGERTLRI